MITAEEKLKKIEEKMKTSSSIKETSDLYFEAKGIIFGDESVEKLEIIIAASIFYGGYNFVEKYCLEKGVKGLADEELNLLLILCDEASVNFDYLLAVFPSIFAEEDSERKQEEVQTCRENILEEKAKREMRKNQQNDESEFESEINNKKNDFQNESLRIRMDRLQEEINNLRGKSKIVEANSLQKRVEVIRSEKEKKDNPTKDNPTKDNPTKDNPTKDNPTKDNSSFSPRSFFIGGTVFLVVGGVIFFLTIKSNRNKNRTK